MRRKLLERMEAKNIQQREPNNKHKGGEENVYAFTLYRVLSLPLTIFNIFSISQSTIHVAEWLFSLLSHNHNTPRRKRTQCATRLPELKATIFLHIRLITA